MIIECPHCGGLNRVMETKLQSAPTCGKCKEALFTGRPIEMSSSQFNRALTKTELPMVVDFWAPWCGPCKTFGPTFAQAAATIEPYARLVKINTEVEQQVAMAHNIRSIPTLAIFKNGQEIKRVSGAMNLPQFIEWVKSSI
jgi:thioredoxin 2